MSYAAQTDEYLALQDDDASDADARKASYTTLVNDFYDLVTDFYLYGWGDSFHFARRQPGEGFRQATLRHQLYLADRLDLRPGLRVADLGCGVGGPMRAIARATGARVVGVNNNAYQLGKAEAANRAQGLTSRCELVKADFMRLPFADRELDGAYAIEATVHAPERAPLFREIRRALKPGALFASYEWVMTDRYDPSSAEHRRVKRSMERGNGLPELITQDAVRAATVAAGFEVLELRDLADDCDAETPWYHPLTGQDRSLGSLTRRPLARTLTRRAVGALESIRLVPAGSSKVSDFLNEAADSLVEAGKIGIFTPMAFLLARNPG
jgi:sterol 24-C-methyltransferase